MEKDKIHKKCLCNEPPGSERLIELMLDNEATEDQNKLIQVALNSCPKCLQNYQTEIALRHQLKTSMANNRLPEHVIQAIRHKIRETAQ